MSDDRPMSLPSPDEFYVGYFPMPPNVERAIRWSIVASFAIVSLIATALSRLQGDPGTGRWETGNLQTFEGVVQAEPYPMLRALSVNGQPAHDTYLLVEVGKFGGGQRAAPFAGQWVEVSGWLLERDGRKMIELEPGDNAIRRLERVALPSDSLAEKSVPRPSGSGSLNRPPSGIARDDANARVITQRLVTLRGEIVDSKCYLGAMKPGEGKTHKECATLCIAGGIPPMFVTTDTQGRRQYFLLTTPDGRALDDRILPYVADPVEVRGEVAETGGISLLKIALDGVRRL